MSNSKSKNSDFLDLIIESAEETLKNSDRTTEVINLLGNSYVVEKQQSTVALDAHTMVQVDYTKWTAQNDQNSSLTKRMASRLSAYSFRKSALADPDIERVVMAKANEFVGGLVPKKLDLMSIVGVMGKFKSSVTVIPGITMSGSEMLSLLASKDISSLLTIPGVTDIISSVNLGGLGSVKNISDLL